MKKFNYLFLLFLGLSITLFTACNNDDDDGDGITVAGSCNASWKINGTDFSSENMALCVYLDSTLNLSTNLTGGTFILQIDPITSTGTYTIDSSSSSSDPSIVILITQDEQTTIGPLTATVTVTELSNSKAKGTFSGTFFDIADLTQSPNFTVTDGTFEANF